MTFRPFTSAIPYPAFRTVDEARAWAIDVFALLADWEKRMNALLTESRKSPADAIADVDTSEDPDDAPADADALRDDLVANYLPYILGKINSILAALRANGIVEE